MSTRSERMRRTFQRTLGMSPREHHDHYHERGAAGAAEDFALLCG